MRFFYLMTREIITLSNYNIFLSKKKPTNSGFYNIYINSYRESNLNDVTVAPTDLAN